MSRHLRRLIPLWLSAALALLATVSAIFAPSATPAAAQASPNIQVTLTASAGTVSPAGTLVYTFVVTNITTNGASANGVKVVLPLPAGTSYNQMTTTKGSYNTSTQTWYIGGLYPNDSATGTLTVYVQDTTRGTLTATATGSVTGPEMNPANNVSTVSTTVITPDLWVAIAGQPTVLPDDTVTYTLTYGNRSTATNTAASVVIEATLPAGMSYVSSSPVMSYRYGNTVAWSLSSLAIGSSGTITLVARANATTPGGALLTTIATITTSTKGDSTGDNTASTTTTVITPNVRVGVTAPATSLPGGLVDYTLTYANNGTAAAASSIMTDILPNGATFVSATPAPTSQSGQTLSWSLGSLAIGSNGTVIVRAQLDTDLARGATLTNSASISTTTPGDPPGDSAAGATTTVIAPEMQVSLSGPARVTASEQLTYTLAYTNSGTATAGGVMLTDTLPTGATFVSATPAPSSQSGQQRTWDIGTLVAGANGTISLILQADAVLTNGATLTNGASISTTTPGDTPAGNSALWETLVERADVTLTLSSPASLPVMTGTPVDFYLDYANAGPATARAVVLTAAAPSQLTSVSWSCVSGCMGSGSGNSIAVSLGDLAAGASGRVRITGTAVTSAGREDVNLTAHLGTTTPEVGTANNDSSLLVSVWTSDLTLAAVAAPTAVAGSTFTATLTVRNTGPAPASNSSLTATLPSGISLVSASPAPTSQSGQTNTWELGTMADQEEHVVALTLRAGTGLDGGTTALINASVNGIADRDLGNDTGTTTTVIQREADLRITVSGPARALAGEQLTYTLTYTNAGPSQARAVLLTDTFPAEGSYLTATPAPNTTAAGQITWSLGDLAAGQSGVITFVLTTSASQAQPALAVVNQAALTDGGTNQPGGGGINTDPSPADASASGTTVVQTVDLAVEKAGVTVGARAGQPYTYAITITNAGPADASAVVLHDTLPASLSFLSSTPTASLSGPQLTWTLGDIPAGESRSVMVTVRIATDASGALTTATMVESPTPDRASGNNNASSIGLDGTPIITEADLALTMDGPAGPVTGRETITYTLTYTNSGPALAADVVVINTVPPNFAVVSATPPTTSRSGRTLTWALGAQDAGATGTIILVGRPFTIAASEAQINDATISSPTTDPTPNNTSASVTTVVETVDLAIEQAGITAKARAGEDYTYTITITNAGPATATNVVVTDGLPETRTLLESTPAATTEMMESGPQLTWELGDIPAGESRTITVRVHIASNASGTLTTTTTVTSSVPDRDSSNDGSTYIGLDGTPIVVEADLTLTLEAPAGPILSGDTVVYTLTWANAGPALAENVVVTATVPPGFTLTSATPAATSQSGNTLTWALGDRDAGASGTIRIVGTLTTAEASEAKGATASISSPTADPSPADASTSGTTVVQTVDLAVEKAGITTSARAGQPYTYAITITNTGPADATAVVLHDTLPASLSFLSSTPAATSQSDATHTWELGDILAGESRTITVTVRIATDASGALTTATTVESPTPDRTSGNNSASGIGLDGTPIIVEADLTVTLNASTGPVLSGDTVVYTLTWANAGPALAENVVLEHTLPTDFTLVSAEPTPTFQNGISLAWDLGNQDAGTTGTIILTGTPFSAEASEEQVATATISATTTDPTPENATMEASTIVQTSDVRVSTDLPDIIVAGQPFTATVRVENRGAAAASQVILTNELPPEMAPISATPAPSGPGLRWDLGDLVAGQEMIITLLLHIPSTVARDTSLAITAMANTPTPDRDTDNNIASDNTVVWPRADLSLTVDGTTEPILSGESATYTLHWANAGPSLAEQVVVTTTLPPGFTFVSATPDATYQDGSSITWDLGGQDAEASGTITLVGTLTTVEASEAKVNDAAISAATDDPDLANNQATTTVTVETVDLAVEKAGITAGARAGEDYTYAITITNAGPADASAVVLHDTLPASLRFLSSTPAPSAQDDQQRTWELGDIPAGESRTITVTVRIATDASGALTTETTVESPEPDRDSSNNSGTSIGLDGTSIVVEADLTLTLGGTAGPVRSSDAVTYTVIWANTGPSKATGVVLHDTLPPGFTLVSTTPEATNQDGNTLTWELGDQDAGATGTITLTGTLTGEGTITTRSNVAAISATTTDPAEANNAGTDPITVLKPDLRIATAARSSFQPGDLLTYQVVVENTGFAAATGVVVTATPPLALEPGDGWQEANAGTYTQAIPEIAAETAVTLTMRVRLPSPLLLERAVAVVAVTDDGSAGNDPTPDDHSYRADDPLIAGAASGQVWIDRDRDGSRDVDEPSASGITVELRNATGTMVVAQATTNNTGAYQFTGFPLGMYRIQIDPASLPDALAGAQLTTEPTVIILTETQRDLHDLALGLALPLSQVIETLTAERDDNGVTVQWSVQEGEQSPQMLVYRGTSAKYNQATVLEEVTSTGSGGTYQILDTSAEPTQTYYYWIVWEAPDGTTTARGPVTVNASILRLYLPIVVRS